MSSLLDDASTIATLDGQTRRGAALREAAIAAIDADADPVRAALWHERLGRARWLAADTVGALRAYEAALAIRSNRPARRGRASCRGTASSSCCSIDGTSRGACARRRSPSPGPTATARSRGTPCDTLGLDYGALGRSTEGVASLEEALRIAVAIGNNDDIGRANVNLANALLYVGEPERAADVVRDGMAEAQALGMASSYGSYLAHTGVQVLNDLGRWAEALELGTETFASQHLEPHSDRYGLARLGAAARVGRGSDGRGTARSARTAPRGRADGGPILGAVPPRPGGGPSLARPPGGGAGRGTARSRRCGPDDADLVSAPPGADGRARSGRACGAGAGPARSHARGDRPRGILGARRIHHARR